MRRACLVAILLLATPVAPVAAQHDVCWDLCRDRGSHCEERCSDGACRARCERDTEQCWDRCAEIVQHERPTPGG